MRAGLWKARSNLNRIRKWIIDGYIRKWIIIGFLVGVIAGIGSLALYLAIDVVTTNLLGGITGFMPPPTGVAIPKIVYPHTSWGMYLIPVSTTLGGLISGMLVYGLAPEAEGHGTDAAIEAFHFRNGVIRRRIPPVKFVASAVTIGSGGSAGREGPIAQIAAGFGSLVADFFGMDDKDRRLAMAAGIGAGIGSIFMAPLGGALLSTEVLYRRDFEVEALIPSIIASVTGYSIFGYFFSYKPLFTISGISVGFYHPMSLLLYALLGVLAGALGILYVRTFYGVKARFASMKRVPKFLRPAIGGLLVGVIGIEFPQILGLGYGWVQLLFSGHLSSFEILALPPIIVLLILALLKIICTSFSISSGGSGGVYAPGIVIGSFMGGVIYILLHPLFPYLSIADVVIVSMIAFMGGVSKAPISIMIMGTEMTGGYALFLPLMLSTVLAYFVSGTKNSIYQSQVQDRAHSPAHQREFERPLMDYISVADAMQSNVVTVDAHTDTTTLKSMLMEQRAAGAVVMDDGRIAGYLDINAVDGSQAGKKALDLAVKNVKTIDTRSSVHAAFNLMTGERVSVLVVVDGDKKGGSPAGVLTLEDIATAYNSKLEKLGNE
ncbi:MAG: chloride channel protein [Methanomassiliicoccales archaeon]